MTTKKKQLFREWFDQQLVAEPTFQQQVEEVLQAMRLEQDLVALRERRGMSQEQLAQTLGVSQPAIAKLESGQNKNLELRTLVRHVHALGGTVEIHIMCGGSRPRRKAIGRSRQVA